MNHYIRTIKPPLFPPHAIMKLNLSSKKNTGFKVDPTELGEAESMQSYVMKKMNEAMDAMLDFQIFGFSIFKKRKTLHISFSKDFDSFRRIVLHTPDGKSHTFLLTK